MIPGFRARSHFFGSASKIPGTWSPFTSSSYRQEWLSQLVILRRDESSVLWPDDGTLSCGTVKQHFIFPYRTKWYFDIYLYFFFKFDLWFYVTSQSWSCRDGQLTTLFLERLTALLESAVGREWSWRFHDQSPRKNVAAPEYRSRDLVHAKSCQADAHPTEVPGPTNDILTKLCVISVRTWKIVYCAKTGSPSLSFFSGKNI